MKVIVDNKVPFIKDTLDLLGVTAVYIPGGEINNEVVKDADALIVRTRTKCDEKLLRGSNVKFIATATIGYDHIDTSYCESAGIEWTNAAGCNSGAVEQYLHSALLLLQRDKGVKLEGATIGIIGVGHVGSRVEKIAKTLGMNILLNDLPRMDNGEDGFVSLSYIAEHADIITFHTPLIHDGRYRTFHLADSKFFNSLKRKPYIINTSRGEVVDTSAILDAISNSTISDAILDVWENEPDINLTLLDKAFIATPHIAGYSADGKINATRMSLISLFNFFRIEHEVSLSLPPSNFIGRADYYNDGENYLEVYNPTNDSDKLKAEPENFENFRSNYNLRREL